jgi:ribonuclease VapC
MFIDASALVSMLTDAEEGDQLAARMQSTKTRMTSPIAVWEATVSIARILGLNVDDTRASVEAFLDAQNIQNIAVPPKAGSLAIDAYNTYGKGRHAAQLNFGDCMAYACAKYYRKPLLFKGNHFVETDIQSA